MTVKTIIGATLVIGLLAGCSQRDVILPGERLDLRDGLAGQTTETANRTAPIRLPAAQANSDWTHRNGGPEHRITHPALGASLAPVFAVDIGEGNSRRARITADPVVAGGRVFTLDARALVTATSTAGAPLWSHATSTGRDSLSDASGGGIAYGDGKVIVTTGFGRVTALDPATGAVLWEQELNAPGSSAPTVRGSLIYVMSRDSRAWALESGNGRIRWQLAGTPTTANFSGGAGAAVARDLVIFPFSSGEILAAFPEGGLRRWSAVVAGQRLGRAAATVSDIAGDPVVDGNRVYAGNISGTTVALDLATGDRIWTATEGAAGPVWPVGGSVFMVNDLNQLVRLDAADGSVIWRVDLPQFEQDRARRQKTLYAHFGPILAGGRLIVASSDGVIRQFDPASGALIGQVALPGGAASNPVVAGGTLYVVTNDGQLLAFR